MAYESPLTIAEVVKDISANKICSHVNSKRICMEYRTN